MLCMQCKWMNQIKEPPLDWENQERISAESCCALRVESRPPHWFWTAISRPFHRDRTAEMPCSRQPWRDFSTLMGSMESKYWILDPTPLYWLARTLSSFSLPRCWIGGWGGQGGKERQRQRKRLCCWVFLFVRGVGVGRARGMCGVDRDRLGERCDSCEVLETGGQLT